MQRSIWEDCLSALRSDLTETQFNTWIKPLSAIEDESAQTLTLLAPNKFVVSWVQKNYLDQIKTLADNRGEQKNHCGHLCRRRKKMTRLSHHKTRVFEQVKKLRLARPSTQTTGLLLLLAEKATSLHVLLLYKLQKTQERPITLFLFMVVLGWAKHT